ncbi:hypothetical protein BDV98DRAFT_583642 [Pterulicium gracile]|uniref:Uncharacterized protein n=1 Tax=Pterulicium gracile TaxID=1884261 RepID=A0A5C3QJL7_9AGAR|nr:hypothetical protein BDV98DRAFT_583642 [Pterula gracilis]
MHWDSMTSPSPLSSGRSHLADDEQSSGSELPYSCMSDDDAPMGQSLGSPFHLRASSVRVMRWVWSELKVEEAAIFDITQNLDTLPSNDTSKEGYDSSGARTPEWRDDDKSGVALQCEDDDGPQEDWREGLGEEREAVHGPDTGETLHTANREADGGVLANRLASGSQLGGTDFLRFSSYMDSQSGCSCSWCGSSGESALVHSVDAGDRGISPSLCSGDQRPSYPSSQVSGSRYICRPMSLERECAGLGGSCGDGLIGKGCQGEDELERWFQAQVESGIPA